MFRPEVTSHRVLLRAMKGIILSGPAPAGSEQGFCSDPKGRDILTSLEEAAAASCGDCKKLSMVAARRIIESQGCRRVDLCITVSPDPEEHVFLRVDGRYVDPAVEAGMPPRRIGAFIAETVWEASP
jgi:hypothetical protein